MIRTAPATQSLNQLRRLLNPIRLIQIPPHTLKQHLRHRTRHRIPNLLLLPTPLKLMIEREALQRRILAQREISLARRMVIVAAVARHGARQDRVRRVRRSVGLLVVGEDERGRVVVAEAARDGGERVVDAGVGPEAGARVVGMRGERHAGEYFSWAGWVSHGVCRDGRCLPGSYDDQAESPLWYALINVSVVGRII